MRVLVTGSATGLGYDTASSLLDDGHEVIVHVRSEARRSVVGDLTKRGAAVVVGDLADADQTLDIVPQLASHGAVDAIIHNAGVIGAHGLLAVNVFAPYLLTALIPADRHIYLSSSMHRGGRPAVDWAGSRASASYSDSKLLVTTLSTAVARLLPDTISNAVDPGWVPTRMGGAGAPDDLRLGHSTQQWLATSDDPTVLTTGGYWYHQQRQRPHPSVLDEKFQDGLVQALEEVTSVPLTFAMG